MNFSRTSCSGTIKTYSKRQHRQHQPRSQRSLGRRQRQQSRPPPSCRKLQPPCSFLPLRLLRHCPCPSFPSSCPFSCPSFYLSFSSCHRPSLKFKDLFVSTFIGRKSIATLNASQETRTVLLLVLLFVFLVLAFALLLGLFILSQNERGKLVVHV
jgi:hypothetical protein